MTREQIEEIIFRVLSGQNGQALSLEVPVEVSARHVHLTEEAVEQLFGPGARLTPKRPLSQPGQYLSEERVTLVTPKGRIEHVAVLGPVRKAIQTELSLTDCRQLGIQAPLRLSGDLEEAADIYLIGPRGMVEAKGSVIVARAHIHITPAEAAANGLADGQAVSATIQSERPVTLEHVVCRVSSQASLAMHIDFDEANGCMLPPRATARIKVIGRGAAMPEAWPAAGKGNAAAEQTQPAGAGKVNTGTGGPSDAGSAQAGAESPCLQGASPVHFREKLMTESVALRLAKERSTQIILEKGAILTPSAKDVLRHAEIDVTWQTGGKVL